MFQTSLLDKAKEMAVVAASHISIAVKDKAMEAAHSDAAEKAGDNAGRTACAPSTHRDHFNFDQCIFIKTADFHSSFCRTVGK